MSGRRDRLRSRFLADQRAAVVDAHARLLAEQVAKGGGVVTHTHPVAKGFNDRLRMWRLNGLTGLCDHLDPTGAPAPAFWLARRPERVRCATCLLEVLDRPAGQEPRCDSCTRPGLELAGFWILSVIDLPVLLMADICGDCAARGAAS